jgi:hypothetical protein
VKDKVELLGFEVSSECVKPSPERTKDIKQCPFPDSIDKLRQFLGKRSFFRRHIRNFSDTAEILFQAIRTGKWNPGTQEREAFAKLRDALLDENNLLGHYDPELTTDLLTDASSVGL